MVLTEVFDLWNIFANELVGDIILFIFLALALIWFLSAKFKMPKELSIMFGIFFGLIVFAKTFMEAILVFCVLIVGLIFYYNMNKAMR